MHGDLPYSIEDFLALIPRINLLGETYFLWLYSGNVQYRGSMLIFVKIQYKTTAPASHVDIRNLTLKILYHIELSLTRFDTLQMIYNKETL